MHLCKLMLLLVVGTLSLFLTSFSGECMPVLWLTIAAAAGATYVSPSEALGMLRYSLALFLFELTCTVYELNKFTPVV